MIDPIRRRDFLTSAPTIAAAGAAILTTAGFTATARGFFANETIRIGLIGYGGRTRHLMGALGKIPGIVINGVCDVSDDNLAAGQKIADAKAFATKDYQALLDRKDIDAVLIGTPDHWHVPITIAACNAGKDVYVEKPLTHELSEGQPVIDAQARSGRIVQVGTQQRSMPHLQAARDILKRGDLGKIHKVHLTWNRNTNRANKPAPVIKPESIDWKRFLGTAKAQPFDEYRYRQWRWFWDFGGGIFTDLMVHWLDVAHWFLDLDHPTSAMSIGDSFMAKGLWETPDTVQTLLRYPDQQVQIYFEGTFSNARNRAMAEFMGSEGTLYVDRGRYEIHPDPGKSLKASDQILGTGAKGLDFYDQPEGERLHLANWLECIRTRKAPNSPVLSGVQAAAGAHLANLSLRSGQVATWKG